ncbi:MAG: DUF2510 domain-containing protein [Demequina sp.]|nr:DUF2510 domain-containing protein [Demequina sp.]
MSTPPPNWYTDPAQPAHLRYWDGTQWTAHVAPGVPTPSAAAQPVAASKMSGGTIAAIVIGAVAVILIVIGILAAIAIPVFLDQKKKEADLAARQSVTDLGVQISAAAQDHAGLLPTATAFGSAVQLGYGDGADALVLLQPTISFGGLVGSDGDHWCVWVSSPNGTHTEYQYSTWGELEPGSCGP